MAETERLYYGDSYLTRAGSRIVARSEDGLRVVLDRTVFYPTSGGQPHDVGVLNGVEVLDVIEEDGAITHVLAGPLASDIVEGSIAWERRYDHMQQHTGQHLLSAIFEELFQIPTLSFRMGDESATIELGAKELIQERVEAVVLRATEAARMNPRVLVTFEEAGQVQGLRKVSQREGTLRIVKIEGLDKSACGGTHVAHLAEVLPLQIRGMEKVRGNIRVSFVCGNRGLKRMQMDFQILDRTARNLGIPPERLPEQVGSLQERLADSEKQRQRLESEAAGRTGLDLYQQTVSGEDGVRRAAIRYDAIDESARAMAKAFASQAKALILLYSPDGVLLACSTDAGVNAGAVLRDILVKYGARGGGSATLAQGGLPNSAVIDELKAALQLAERV